MMRTTRIPGDPYFTEYEINSILENYYHWSRKTANKKQPDLFNLHMVITVGNAKDGEWDLLDGTYMHWLEHSIGIDVSQFWDCHNEEEVIATFSEVISARMREEI